MIEISVDPSQKRLHLMMDGVICDDSETTVLPMGTMGSEGVGLLFSPNEELLQKLLARCFSDFPTENWTLTTHAIRHQLIKSDNEMSQRITVYRRENDCYLRFEFNCDSSSWKGLWSISDYQEEFKRVTKESGKFCEPGTLKGAVPLVTEFVGNRLEDKYTYDLDIEEGGPVLLPVRNLDVAIEEEIRSHSALFQRLHELTQVSLMSRIRRDSVVVQFEFPKEAQVACEQYLLYFVEFLKELGVEASAELRHESSQVLFAVTPKDQKEALHKIRAALHVYLCLPTNDIIGGENEIEVQRLISNIYHLKSQLVLARAVLQAKDATIEAQRYTITQQEHLLSDEIMVKSLRKIPEKPKGDSEEVLDGLAEITKYEGKGFAVNLPELFRRLKSLFSED